MPPSLRAPLPACAPSRAAPSRKFHVGPRLLLQARRSQQQQQNRLPASYYRGGTSRAVFFKQSDLPRARSAWPPIFRGVLGSPDAHGRQLDGLGGGASSLSKVCVVGRPATHPRADVDYTFAAVGVRDDAVDLSSNCGNMTAAVGPFAVDAGMVDSEDGEAVVRIHNTNTGKIIRASFPVRGGEAVAAGDLAIGGVAGTGARVRLAFLDPAGSKTGRLLPTGNVTDVLDGVEATCIDVGNPCVFVQAADLGVEGGILPDAIEAHPTLLTRLDSIRRKAGMAMGIADDEASVPGSIPKIAMVSAPHAHTLTSGERVDESFCDVVVRAISVGQPHGAVPITVAMALAAASRLEGSTVQRNTSSKLVDPEGLTVGHSTGNILVASNFDDEGNISDVSLFRTARRLMEGTVFWK